MTDTTPPQPPDPPNRRSVGHAIAARLATLPAVLLLALAVRGGVLLTHPEGLDRDTDGYRGYAEKLLCTGVYGEESVWYKFGRYIYYGKRGIARETGGYTPRYDDFIVPDAYRPPLFVLVLTKIARNGHVAPAAIGWLHLALGLATVWLTCVVGRKWGLGRLSLAAAALVACDPILLNQSTQIMTETLATFLAVLGLFCLTRLDEKRTFWEAGLAGGCLALAALCRPVFLVWLVMAAVATLLLRTGPWRRTANVATFLFIAIVVLAPWAIRNYRVLGQPIVTTTHGGNTLLLGNNPEFYRYLREGHWGTALSAGQRLHTPDSLFLLRLETGDDVASDKEAYQLTRKHIRENPGMFAYSCVYRVRRLWGLLPFRTEANEPIAHRLSRWSVACWYAVAMMLSGIGAWTIGRRLWRTPWLWGLLLCAAVTGVHTFYWTDMRMRAPFVPVLCLAAAVGIGRVAARWKTRKA